jgi:hypothetical protein
MIEGRAARYKLQPDGGRQITAFPHLPVQGLASRNLIYIINI